MNNIVYFLENGRKRKGEKANCELCGKEFLRRIKPYPGRKKRRYCTRPCATVARQKRIALECHICGAEVERAESKVRRSKHGIFFCSRECKDFAQSIEGNCEEIQPAHYGTGSWINYREKCKKQFLKGCRCGEKKRYKLLVHHRDSNRKNNKMSNLEVVCYSCHAVRHLKQVNGVWVFDYNALTPRNCIKELT